MISLLATMAHASPALDDLDAWEAILDAGLLGPPGCWDVEGTVSWRHEAGSHVNAGSAAFQVRFDDHRFGTFSLSDTVYAHEDLPALDGQALPLQFRPVLGRGQRWLLHWGDGLVFLGDPPEDHVSTWVETDNGSVWVQAGDDGFVTVNRALGIEDRGQREATTTAYVMEGADHASFVYTGRDPHLQRGGVTQHRSRKAIYHGADGFPTREVLDVTFHSLGRERTASHEITYDSFRPCAPSEVEGYVPVPTSAELFPVFEDAPEADRAHWEAFELRRQARRDLLTGGFVAASLGAGIGLFALRDPVEQREQIALRGALWGAAGAYALFEIGKGVSRLTAAKRLERE